MARAFTVLEMCIALAILAVLMGVILAMSGKFVDYLGEQNTRQAFVLDATSALSKLDAELRECGQTTLHMTTTYPYVTTGGAELAFLRLDTPPCTFDGTTDLRWNPTEMVVKVVNGQLGIWAGNAGQSALVATLVTNVSACIFSIAGRAITVDLELADMDAKGAPIRERFRRIIVMRN